MYYSEPRSLDDTDLRLIEGAGHVAVIAIEGERSHAEISKAHEEIAKSEAELRTIIEALAERSKFRLTRTGGKGISV